MNNISKNIVAAIIALFVAAPFFLFFDIAINGYFNPQYGIWSQAFLNGNLALGMSVILFASTLVAPMATHSYIINKFSA